MSDPHTADSHAHAAHPAGPHPEVPASIRDEAANTPSWVPWTGAALLVCLALYGVIGAAIHRGEAAKEAAAAGAAEAGEDDDAEEDAEEAEAAE